MNIFLIIIDLLELIGGVMIAFMVIKVHDRIVEEYRIDRKVVKVVKREHLVTFTGIGCLTLSFILRMIYYLFL
ncbi:MAG: hypothetical protein KAT32_02300 [Candidatus Moranbacteria bacterium]|nr:hypothetical protein [Candidatus Moranbacteria bacterium]